MANKCEKIKLIRNNILFDIDEVASENVKQEVFEKNKKCRNAHCANCCDEQIEEWFKNAIIGGYTIPIVLAKKLRIRQVIKPKN